MGGGGATPVCGDGALTGAEKCDDGNAQSNDGCSASCALESGWTCGSALPTVCTAVCGDGLLVGKEAEAGGCDDQNSLAQDGCAECKVENEFVCSGTPSVCKKTCGDGKLDPGEKCDDANAILGDGCVSCAISTGYQCNNTTLPSACNDIDECAAATSPCNANGTCTNKPGSFSCACKTGYVGDGVTCTALNRCPTTRTQLLGTNDVVAATSVDVVSNSGGVVTLHIDATAGGLLNALKNPWVFISLSTPGKVGLTDVTSIPSTGWDLALKRTMLYANGGDGGAGKGSAVRIAKEFAQVTAADATSAVFATERFFDDQCKALPEPTNLGLVLTSFTGWDEEDQDHLIYPRYGTYLVKSASGKLYKLAIFSFYGTAAGGTNGSPAHYLIQFAAL